MDLYDDAGLVRRGGRWEVLAPDECVVAVAGRAASMVSDLPSWQQQAWPPTARGAPLTCARRPSFAPEPFAPLGCSAAPQLFWGPAVLPCRLSEGPPKGAGAIAFTAHAQSR